MAEPVHSGTANVGVGCIALQDYPHQGERGRAVQCRFLQRAEYAGAEYAEFVYGHSEFAELGECSAAASAYAATAVVTLGVR